MRTVLFASLRTYARRYAAAVVAVVAAVALIVVTNALTTATKSGLQAGLDDPFENAAGGIQRPSDETVESYVEQGGWPMATSFQPVRTETKQVGDQVSVGTVSTEKRWQWQSLESGRFPTGPGEAVADAAAAEAQKVSVGDTIRVGSGTKALELTVVGLVDAPSMWSSNLYVTWPQMQEWNGAYVPMLLTASTGSADDGWKASGALVDELQKQLNNEIDVIAYMVLIFAAIALFVSVLVITNTFTILFAQRMRDFALLRAMGATKRQVLRSVRREALALGVMASLAGLVVGTLLGWGIVAVVSRFAENAPLGEVSYEWPWLVGAAAIGILTTLVASWLPTRRLMRLSPLAALRPQEGFEARGAGRIRLGLGVAVLLVGVAMILLAMVLAEGFAGLLAVMAGGSIAFVGVMLLGPALVPGLVRLVGHGLARLVGTPAKLASANAGRNPKRTAATAASLLVGVTLTTGVLTGMNTIRGAVSDDMERQHPIDAVLQSGAEPIAADALRDVKKVDGVADAVAVPGAMPSIEPVGKGESAPMPLPVVAPPASDVPLQKVSVEPGTIVLGYEAADELVDGDKVRLTLEGRSTTVKVAFADVDGAARISAATLAELTQDPKTYAIWVRATDNADPEELGGALSATLPDADLANGKADRAWVELQLDVMTWSVVGLLAISVLIALAGIANTLGLSVLERGREHALLRALGLTRRQLRRTLAAEAVLLSAVAAVVGTVLGVFIAWGGSEVLLSEVLSTGAQFDPPVLQLIGVVVVAGLAGLVSCVVPSRRATKVSPAEGLALD
ncbi:putative ABC transport system permease protein [Nocardioides albertanoniae]|uniref:Putative ABC transport system permease protein n=1 Tax=Nocardioides albertanoniae TaxID=1175486 RepID=A0A543A5R3_9ACTN|nr:FtsX-like permease family protein [Nocardioides albertanoniae]TQL67887.1 putative ABC transport system permease protein [Nocardioides albertanoniae]